MTKHLNTYKNLISINCENIALVRSSNENGPNQAQVYY